MSILTLLVVGGLIYLVIRLQIFLLKILVGLALIGMVASGAMGQTTTVRDSTGRVIQTQDYRHRQTTVRDEYGRTTETWQHQAGEKIVRDRYGRVLRMERGR